MAQRSTRGPSPKSAPRRAASRNDQVVRVLMLLHDLGRSAGEDLYALAERYGTSVRTVRRDLAALQEAGIPLKREGADDSPRQRWSVDTAVAMSHPILMDTSHYIALRIATDEGRAVKGHGALSTALEDLLEKVEKALGPKGRAELKAIDACFFSWDKFAWRSTAPDVLWPLVSAIRHRNLCELVYRAPSHGNVARTVTALPLRLFVHNGAMYAHAWQVELAKVVVLNLRRVESLKVTKQTLAPPPEYRTDDFEAASFGLFIGSKEVEYLVRFDAEAAPYILERTWHPTQVTTPRADGGVDLRFTCAESYEVPAWVASWREHAEVLAPSSVRKEMQSYARFLEERYRLEPSASKATTPVGRS